MANNRIPAALANISRRDPSRGPSQLLEASPRKGIALCLSGGGYRAALFHVGALRRLNELGILSQIDTISCVSGGSIIGAYLATRISSLGASNGVFLDFDRILDDFLAIVDRDIRTVPALSRLLVWKKRGQAPRALEKAYRDHLLGDAHLSELPERPRFIFCATDLYFANSWICERRRVGDYLAGYVSPPPPDWTLARAVAVSSCFPPVFNPLPAEIDPAAYSLPQDSEGEEETADDGKLQQARREITLTDGGVYDNLGIEPVWKRHETVLVSDGGKPIQYEYVAPGLRILRYQDVIQNQVGSLRKRWLIDIYERAKRGQPDTFNGTYWGIMSSTGRYQKDPGFGYGDELAARIADIRTDLNRFTPNEIAVLNKHGYELADVAIHTHAQHLLPALVPPRSDWTAELKDELQVAQALRWSGWRFVPRRLLGPTQNLVR